MDFLFLGRALNLPNIIALSVSDKPMAPKSSFSEVSKTSHQWTVFWSSALAYTFPAKDNYLIPLKTLGQWTFQTPVRFILQEPSAPAQQGYPICSPTLTWPHMIHWHLPLAPFVKTFCLKGIGYIIYISEQGLSVLLKWHILELCFIAYDLFMIWKLLFIMS